MVKENEAGNVTDAAQRQKHDDMMGVIQLSDNMHSLD
jgi:hypothetical protein